MGLFNRRQKNEMNELKSTVIKLSAYLDTDLDHLSSFDMLTFYPFIFADKYKSEPFLFENEYCQIETYIACTCKVYINCFSKIINSNFKRNVFTNSYKNNCAKIISKMLDYDYETIIELINNRYKIYLTRDCRIYNHFQQIILYSQNSDCFIEYNRNTPQMILDGIQDYHLQIKIMSLLEGLSAASERQCAEVATYYSNNYRGSFF